MRADDSLYRPVDFPASLQKRRPWLSVGARPSRPVAILLGLAGILPPHPRSLVTAARNREALSVGALTLDALDEAEKDEEAEDSEKETDS